MSAALALVLAAAALTWVVSLYLWPFKPCPRCKGGGTNRGSNRRRHGDCRRCHRDRRVPRVAARTIHRAARRGRAATTTTRRSRRP
jgi:hypothetical protein